MRHESPQNRLCAVGVHSVAESAHVAYGLPGAIWAAILAGDTSDFWTGSRVTISVAEVPQVEARNLDPRFRRWSAAGQGMKS